MKILLISSKKRLQRLIPLIISVSILTPFSGTIYLSALPLMANVFKTGNIGLVMTIFMVSLAGAQLFYGPLLDRFGRKPVLLSGVCIFAISTLFILISPNFTFLLLFRFCQGIGACSAIVSAIAIAKDTYGKNDIVKAMSIIMATIGISPVIAPLFGSFLTIYFGWQGPFLFLLVLSVIFIFIIVFLFSETHKEKNMKALRPKFIFKNYISILRVNNFPNFILTSACSYGVLFSYFLASSEILINQYHFSLTNYGVFFAVNGFVVVIIAMLSPKLVKVYGLTKLLFIGAILLLIGSVSTLFGAMILGSNIYLMLFSMCVATVGVGFIRATASSGAIALAPKGITGSSSSLYNFTSSLGGTISTGITAYMTVNIFNYGILASILSIIACFFAYRAIKK